MTKRATVIIPHYNDAARLKRCLTALMVDVPPDVDVLVVDNASDESPGPMLAQGFPAVRLVVQPEAGAAHARNMGVARSEAEGLLFLDADCVPDPGWLDAGLAAMDQVDVAGGPVHVFDEGDGPRSGAQAFEAVFAFDMLGYLERDGFLGSGNLVTRRAVFDVVGPFRPGLSEDKDWSHRARQAGFALTFLDGLSAGHPSRGDWPALARKWRRLTDESWGLHRANGRGRASWVLRALLMPASVLVHAPKIILSGKLNSPSERVKALMTLARLRLARMVWMIKAALGRPL